MIQCGDGFGFPLESFVELLGGNLERDNSIQPRIAGLVYLSHPAFAGNSKNFVWAEFVAWRECHVLDSA